jgi:hypothetical protein
MEFGGETNPNPELETSAKILPPLNVVSAFAVENHDVISLGCAYMITLVPDPPTKKCVPLKHDEYFDEIVGKLREVKTLLEKSVQ